MSIPAPFFDEIRNRLNLSDVIGKRVKVTRAGREFKACCPFHHEKTPSFTINDDKQFYHCFGCGAHGDVIKFTMEHDNLAFMDAIEMLAAEAGLQVPKASPEEAARAKKANDLYDLMEAATSFFEKALAQPHNHDAMTYLLDRGFTRETIAEFRLGFAPDDGQALRKYLNSLGYSDKDMITAGVARASTRGTEPYAFFRDRVMFPVPDRRGRIVAFGGRVLPEHLRPPQRSDFTPPKYINSSETPLFHKGKMLYGEPKARRAAAEDQPLILVEGYMDVIACAQSGFNGALAPMGTAVTEEQIQAMWQMIPDFSKVPILCFDGDNAGRKAATRVCERILPLLEPGKSINFAFMPDGEDPDSLIKSSGVKGLNDVLSQSVSLFDFIWNSYVAGKAFKTPEMRAGVIKQLENEVAKISNQDVQVHYKSLLRSKVSDKFFPRKTFDRNNKGKSNPLAGLRPKRPRAHAQSVFTKVLLAALLNHPHVFEGVEDVISGMSLNNPRHEALRQNIIGELSDDLTMEHGVLIESLRQKGYAQEISDICNESVYVHASFCSQKANQGEVQAQWLKYWNDGNDSGLGQEIQNGWKRVSNEEDEEKLRNLYFMKTSRDNQ